MTTYTTAQVASGIAALEAQFLASTIDQAALSAGLLDYLTNWSGLALDTAAGLAQRQAEIIAQLTPLQTRQFQAWVSGTANGGDHADGTYPLTIGGVVVYLPCPAKNAATTAVWGPLAPWATATPYVAAAPKSIVEFDGSVYVCATPHTSGVFATDLAAGKWVLALRRGDPAGLPFVFSTTTTDADPGAGTIRFDNATIASVAHLYVDNLEGGGADVTTWLDSFDDSSSTAGARGLILLRSSDGAKWAAFRVTGAVIDGSGYRKIPVAGGAGSTLFANNQRVLMSFERVGDRGNSFLYGSGAPGSGAGADGDVYIDIATGDFYGPKASGAWGSPSSSGLSGFTAAAATSATAAGVARDQAQVAATNILKTSGTWLPGVGLCSLILVDDSTSKPYAALGVDNRIWALDSNGNLQAVKAFDSSQFTDLMFKTSATWLPGVGQTALVVTDKADKPVLAVGDNGLFVTIDGVLTQVGGSPGAMAWTATNVTDPFGSINTLRILNDPTILPVVIDWDQSFGGSNPSTSDHPYSTVARHPGRCLTFDGGPWLSTIGQSVSAIVDAVASDPGGGDTESGSVKEPPVIETINTFIDAVDAVYGAGSCPPIFGFNLSAGGHRIAALAKGTDVYNDGPRLMERLSQLAAPLGKRPVLLFMISSEGQQDNKEFMPPEFFARAVIKVAQDFNDLARAVWPAQRELAPMIIQQNGRAAPAVDVDAYSAQGALLAEMRSPLIVCAGPNYAATADPDTLTHPAAIGYVHNAALFGYVAARVVGGIQHTPMRALRCYQTGSNTFRLIYPYPVTVDTTGAIVSPTGIDGVAGVRFRDDSGASPTVTSVTAASLGASSIMGAVDVTLSAAPVGYNQRFYVGTRPSGLYGRLNGPRCLIRSTASLGNDVRGIPVYLWAAQQTVPVGLNHIH